MSDSPKRTFDDQALLADLANIRSAYRQGYSAADKESSDFVAMVCGEAYGRITELLGHRKTVPDVDLKARIPAN